MRMKMLFTAGVAFAVAAAGGTTNEVVWGTSIRGVALGIIQERVEYKLGQDIRVTACLTNAGTEKVELLWEDSVAAMYRLDLFDSEGRPVTRLDDMGNPVKKDPYPSTSSLHSWDLRPGRSEKEEFVVNKVFAVVKPGVYYLIAMRNMRAGVKAVCMSSIVRISVVE
jgi:hypothetical protein